MGPRLGYDPANQFAAGHQGPDPTGRAQPRRPGLKSALGIGRAPGYTSDHEPRYSHAIMNFSTLNPNLNRNLNPSERGLGLGLGTAERHGSILIIVLWVAFGLCSIALYFAHSMSMELRAADNNV